MGKPQLQLVEDVTVDKTKALEAAMSQIERSFGKGAIMRMGENTTQQVDVVPTGCLSLDIALGIGGSPTWPHH